MLLPSNSWFYGCCLNGPCPAARVYDSAHSLKQFTSNNLQAYSDFFFSRRLCLWRLWSVFAFLYVVQFSKWLLSDDCRCLLLNTLLPHSLPEKVPSRVRLTSSFLCFLLSEAKPTSVAGSPTTPSVRPPKCLPSFWKQSTTAQSPVIHLPKPCRRPKNSLCDLQQ
jgi:hypothetical protein